MSREGQDSGLAGFLGPVVTFFFSIFLGRESRMVPTISSSGLGPPRVVMFCGRCESAIHF
jgi:hypothetical protein